MRHKALGAIVTVLVVLALAAPAMASPPSPDGPVSSRAAQPPEDVTLRPYAARAVRPAKPIDQPNIKDYLRNQERQRLLEAGLTAEADALAQTGTDRVLVILVEFAGTDVFTWTAGVSTWDPLGIADPDEFTGVIGDCSSIITQTTVFTYTGPAHNEIPRPLSLDDRSGDSIWTEDFSSEWFEGFMFGEGVVFSYTMQDGTPVHEDFTGKSVTDYYTDLSTGVYTITGDVVGWLPLDHSTWWYGADDCPGRRSPYDPGIASSGAIPGAGNSKTLVIDALDAVNAISDTIPGFDWADYDLDGDGIIDRLWIVHSGYGEEDAPDLLNRTDYGESAMWSHSSAVSPPYPVSADISAGAYIMMPENGGIGVFAHEYGHSLGADDLYAYGEGETSVGFWSLMDDDWTGYPIGFEPPAVDPWHLDNWGWLDPYVVTDTTQVYTVTLGQASRFPGGEDVYRGVRIRLPDGELPLPVPVWEGDYYWWGGKKDLSNGRMTTMNPIDLTAATAVTLSFDLVYDIEDEWDFLWVQVSTDGTTWNVTDTLTNTNTQCVHDPGWIGGLYGFPDDLCGAGLGGLYGYNANWPDPETQVFDLSAYAGQSIYLRFWYMTDWATTYFGPYVDNVQVEADGAVLFSDSAEVDGNWDYEYPWIRTNGMQHFTHNYYLQQRNVGENGGYDSALGEERWRFGPANTGLLVWYNNNFYTDNEIFSYLFDDPSFGPKARMLVVDSQPEPYRDPDMVALGYDNEGGNVSHRGLMRDAPFTLQDTVPFTHTDPYREGARAHSYAGRPAVSAFHDSMGYYPGAEYVRRGPAYPASQFKWVTKQWDASAVVPATSPYSLKAPGYTANEEFRWDCIPYLSGPYAGFLGCYWLGATTGLGYDGGTGNPGDSMAQYGWHAELIEEASDHTWATVRIWNSMKELDDTFSVTPTSVIKGGEIDYTYEIHQNIGSAVNALVVIPLDTAIVEYVPGSVSGDAILLPVGMSTQQLVAVYAEGGLQALKELAVSQAGEIGALAWTGLLATGEGDVQIGFSVKVTASGPEQVDMTAYIYERDVEFQTTSANTVAVLRSVYLPLVLKQ
jgi:immune inhibitor A